MFSREVKNEFFAHVISEVKRRTRQNIRQGYRESGYPVSHDIRRQAPGRLAETVEGKIMGDTVEIEYGKGLPYARIHNLPKGTVVTIRAKRHGYLKFPNRKYYGRKGKRNTIVRRKTVRKPGKAVFDEAIEETMRAAPARLSAMIRRRQNSLLRAHKYRLTDAGIKVRIRRKKRTR